MLLQSLPSCLPPSHTLNNLKLTPTLKIFPYTSFFRPHRPPYSLKLVTITFLWARVSAHLPRWVSQTCEPVAGRRWGNHLGWGKWLSAGDREKERIRWLCDTATSWEREGAGKTHDLNGPAQLNDTWRIVTHVCHFKEAWEISHHVPMGQHDSLWVSCVGRHKTHTHIHTGVTEVRHPSPPRAWHGQPTGGQKNLDISRFLENFLGRICVSTELWLSTIKNKWHTFC